MERREYIPGDTVLQQENAENKEEIEFEKILDFLAETMLLRAQKVNEGKNGVILRLDLQDVGSGLEFTCKNVGFFAQVGEVF